MKLHVTLIAFVALGLLENAESKSARTLGQQSLFRRQGDCGALASSMDGIFEQLRMMAPFPNELWADICVHVTGVNLLQSSEMRRVICRLTEASTLSELRTAHDDLGLTYHGVKSMYDLGMALLPMGISQLEEIISTGHLPPPYLEPMKAVLDMLNALRGSSFAGLDPEGVTWATGMVSMFATASRKRSITKKFDFLRAVGLDTIGTMRSLEETSQTKRYLGKHKRTNEEVCEYVVTGLAVIADLSGVSTEGIIDFHDSEAVREVVCGILAVDSIQGIVDTMDEAGIIDAILVYEYSSILHEIPYATAYVAQMMELVEQGVIPASSPQAVMATMLGAMLDGLRDTGFLSLVNDLR